MSNHYRNPAKLLLLQLTPQVIKQFNRVQVIRKLGLNEALTPEDRQQCQQIIFLLKERLAVIDVQEQEAKTQSLLLTNTQEQIAAIKQSSLPFILQQPPIMKWPLLPMIEIPLPTSIPKQMPPIIEKPFQEMKQPFKTKDVFQQNLSSKKNGKSESEEIPMTQTFSRFGSIYSQLQKLQNKNKKIEYSSTFVEEEEQSTSLLSYRDQQNDLSSHTHKKKIE